jgi:pentatricopeptide repeat domain-containing protein 1
MDRAVKGFFNSFPHDQKKDINLRIDEDSREREGKLGEKKGKKKWWEVIAATMPKEDGWKAMWALYQEARRRGVGGGRDGGGLRAKVLRMLEEAAARSAAAGPAAVGGGEGGRGREEGRGVRRRELELSEESSIEELLLGTLSPSMVPRALWLLETMEEEEEEEGREEGGEEGLGSNNSSNSSSSSSSSSNNNNKRKEEEGREGRRRRKPSPEDYHGAISLLVQGGLVDEGLTLLRRQVAQGDRMPLPLPSSYRVIIAGYCRLGRRKSALYLLQDLREGGRAGGREGEVEEEERECVRLIERIGREGEDGREEEVEQQQQLHTQRENEEEGGREGVPTLELLRSLTDTYGLTPPLSSYSRVMKGLGEGGREGEALELLKNMRVRGVKPDVWCYNYALMACARSGWREGGKDVRKVLDEMEEGEKSAFTYSLVIEGLGKAGGWEEAREVLYEMRRRGVQPSVGCYSSAINALGKAGRAREAMDLLREMKQEGEGGREGGVRPNAVVYTAAIDACARRGMVEEAVGLLREMEGGGEGGREGGGLPPNPVAYGCAINACARGREGRRAVGLLREMQEKGLEVTEVHYGAAINGLNLSEEDDELLLSLFEEARGRVTMVVGMWAAAIKAGDRMGAYGTVVEVGEEMIKSGHLPNKRALKLLMLAAERGGRYEEGVGFFERVVRRGEEGREGGVEPCEAANKYALVCAEKVGDVVMMLGCMKRAERMGREGEGKGVEGWMCRLAARVLNRVEVEKEGGEGGREEEKRRMAVVELEAMVGLWRRKAGEETRRKKGGGGVWGKEGEVMFEGEKRLGSWVSGRRGGGK